jgi:3-hydroxyisobutyrate dehydrogenase
MSEKNTTRVTVLGLGAMGSRMASTLLKAGYQVVVWNRNAASVQALEAQGAIAAATPRDAAKDSDFVFAMVRDDVASRRVWNDAQTGALAGMRTGAIAIDSSTLTPAWTRELNEICESRGVAFLEAPVAGSRPQAEAAQLIYFVGGNESTALAAQPLLKTMGASLHHVGPVGNAALVKLLVNALFGIQVAALAELLGMVHKAGLDKSKALEIMSATPVASPAIKLAGGAMLARNFAPMFPIELVEKDFAYVLQASRQVDSEVPVVEAVHGVLANALKKELGGSNITSLASLY